MRQASRWSAAVAVAAWSIACGSGDDPLSRASGPSMEPSAQSGPAAVIERAAGTRVPRIESVRFVPLRPATGETLRASAHSSEADDDPLSFDFVWTVGGQRLAQRGPEITLTRARKGDSIEVTVTASNGQALSAPFSASTRVANQAPRLERIRLEPNGPITVGREVTAHPEADDADGDLISFQYSWRVNGNTIAEFGPVLSTADLRRGDTLVVQVVASDGEDDSDAVEGPKITLANAPPIIISKPGGAGEDGVFRYKVRAEDPDRDRVLRFSLATAPPGMTITSTQGLIQWAPGAAQAGSHPVVVVVDDLKGGQSSQRFEVIVGTTDGAEADAAPPASRL